MSREPLVISRTVSGASAVQAETSMPQTLSGRLRDVLVNRIIRRPRSIFWMLQAWSPEVDGSAELLQLLTKKMHLKWWRQRGQAIRKQILKELIRIDSGRGIISDWLALVVREEKVISVLQNVISSWLFWEYRCTDQLLDAWHDRLPDNLSNKQNIQEMALRVMVDAIFPSDGSSESLCERPTGKAWNEERRAEIILRQLAERLPLKHMVRKLEILADWEPSPELQEKKVLYEIFCEWERHMQETARIIVENRGGSAGGRDRDGRITSGASDDDEKLIQHIYLRSTWKGLIRLSQYCADTSDKLLLWIKYWLQHGDMIAPEIVEEMIRWNPRENVLKGRVALLWSRYLLSPEGYENPYVWAVMKRYFSECKTPGPEMDEICRNCLTAMGSVVKMRTWSKWRVLEAFVCPPWLTKEQQSEWEGLWVYLMQSSSEDRVRVATRHLLGLVTAGLADFGAVKQTILKRLKKMTAETAAEITRGVLEAIVEWEGGPVSPAEMFCEVWAQLRQSPWWDVSEVRQISIKALGACLRNNPAQEKATSGLVALWLETLTMEFGKRNLEAIELLREEQSEIMKMYPDFCPDSVEVWKELGKDEDCKIRLRAWKFLSSVKDKPGSETGVFLVERLREEKHLDVLCVMAQWKPSSGKPLPAGFWDGWVGCLQEFARNVPKHFTEEQVRRIIYIGECVNKIAAMAVLEGQFGTDGQSVKLDDLQAFWKTMAEKMESAGCTKIAKEIERMQKNMDVWFRLDRSPEEFQGSLAGLEVQDKNVFLWEYLIKNLEGRDMNLLTANARHNLVMVTAFLLGQEKYIRRKLQKVFVELCGDGTWTPDRIPAGWEEFCCELHRICTENGGKTGVDDSTVEKICVMIRIGHVAGDERFHRLFRQKLYQIMKTAKSDLVLVAESGLWQEVIRASETIEQSGQERKKLDRAGEYRWVRQLIRSHEHITEEGEVLKDKEDFWNLLWMSLEVEVSSQKTEKGRAQSRGGVSSLVWDSQKIVFNHPRPEENCATETLGRGMEIKLMRQQCPLSFSPG